MLYQFLKMNRDKLIAMCAAKAALRTPAAVPGTDRAIPEFIEQLIETFRLEQTPAALALHAAGPRGKPSLVLVPKDITSSASRHGAASHQMGFTVDQVVHGYGDLCQAVTELAMERDATISVDEFHTFNRCLDDAIADAVTAFSHERQAMNRDPANPEAVSSQAEMRALVDAAIISFTVIRDGKVGLTGTTSSIHEDCLVRLRDLLRSAAGIHSGATPAPL
jgi:hypothetical protein